MTKISTCKCGRTLYTENEEFKTECLKSKLRKQKARKIFKKIDLYFLCVGIIIGLILLYFVLKSFQ